MVQQPKRTIATYNVNESHWLIAEQKKSDAKTYLLYGSTLWSSRSGKIKMIEIGIAALWVGRSLGGGLKQPNGRERCSISASGWRLLRYQFSSVQSLSHFRLFATPWIAARQASLSITNSRSWLKLMSIESVMPSNYLILCRPLLLLPSIFPSIRGFSNESTLHMRWPKYWSFSFSISPSNEYSGLISFRMDWLDLLTVQGTLKSLLQHHSSKAPIFRRSAFFTVQLSHPYMTTEKTIAFTRRIFVGKVMCLL